MLVDTSAGGSLHRERGPVNLTCSVCILGFPGPKLRNIVRTEPEGNAVTQFDTQHNRHRR